ncbi:amino acid/amide ABC transporter ATP-binding protein 2, HAAT family [Rhizobiales bacterium GAS188]|nr:amino acid/amide ABC transporter ATP-binding protein 2, HAAT family [Rhizobiales bacterium GAS188]
MLEIDDIHCYYGDSYILQGLSLSVEPGEIVAVLGRNGVGKTTLLSSIIGFVSPRRGAMRFEGRDIMGLSPERIARQGIALVPQGRRVFASLTVAETLAIAARRMDQARAGRNWSVERVYEAFPRLRERRDYRAANLSGGEQQMLATGRALIANPTLILLDEPTEGLSPLLVRELQGVLRQLKDEGVTMLLVEQRINFALALADRVYLMSKGRIADETTPGGLRADAAMRQLYLGV